FDRRRRRWRGWRYEMSSIRTFLLVFLQIHFVQLGRIDVATHQQINDRARAPEIAVTKAEHQQEEGEQPDGNEESTDLVHTAELVLALIVGAPDVSVPGSLVDLAVIDDFLPLNGGILKQ